MGNQIRHCGREKTVNRTMKIYSFQYFPFQGTVESKLVNLHCLHQRVLLVTLHGSPRRVRARLPARHPLLASSATYTALAPLLRHCLDHPAQLRRYESHVSDQSPTRSTGPGCLRGTCPSWALQPTRPWLLSSRPTPCMYPEGQYSRCLLARPTSSLDGILVVARLWPTPYTEYWSREIMSQHFHIWRDKQTIQGLWPNCIWNPKP